jgi:shikimate kinase / 3-dehydroquinate synthase
MSSLRERTIVFIGFMGAGKSTAAQRTAEALGIEAVDADRLLEERLGKPIERVFGEDGEAAFRSAEEQVTLELLSRPGARVLALGGGAVTHPPVREMMARHLVVWLDVPLDDAWARVEGSGRPLARDRSDFAQLYAEREPVYAALADLMVPGARSRQLPDILDRLDEIPAGTKVLWAAADSGDYPVYVGPGVLTTHGYWPSTLQGQRFLVTDGNVGRLYGAAVESPAATITIMPGEQSKTVAHADIIWTELAQAGMTREDLIVALGGGVIGDLAGFCAATYQRGVRYVQIPTSLVAQVDSAYGGKTGVDLAEAKNYVGAYHQPTAVIVDTRALETLPEAELAAGYAEVLKTALIAGGALWGSIRSGADPAASEIVIACARTKLRIVAQDERDSGLRQVLNLGHTVGHAIEAATGYARYRHGEAVALGLLVALRLSGQPELREEVADLLARRGLPTTLDGTDPDAVVMATARDKKRLGGRPVPFVLLDAPGAAVPGCAVEPRELIAAVRELRT